MLAVRARSPVRASGARPASRPMPPSLPGSPLHTDVRPRASARARSRGSCATAPTPRPACGWCWPAGSCPSGWRCRCCGWPCAIRSTTCACWPTPCSSARSARSRARSRRCWARAAQRRRAAAAAARCRPRPAGRAVLGAGLPGAGRGRAAGLLARPGAVATRAEVLRRHERQPAHGAAGRAGAAAARPRRRGPGRCWRRPSAAGLPIEVVGPYLAEVEYLERRPRRRPPAGGRCSPARPACGPGWPPSWSAGRERRQAAAAAAPAQGADIGLLLEGTYPFVSGGVSSWVHEIITGLPELTFGIVFIGSSPEDYKPIRYKLPPNLVHVETHYLAEQPTPRRMGSSRQEGSRASSSWPSCTTSSASRARDISRGPARGGGQDRDRRRHRLARLPLQRRDLAPDLRLATTSFCTSPSFVDYFWTVRTMHGPLFKMAEIAARGAAVQGAALGVDRVRRLPGLAAAAAAAAAPSS